MVKQVWQSKDGALFDTEDDCLRHERASSFLAEIQSSDQYRRNEERWELQENFSRSFLEGFQRVEDFWNYAESFRVLSDILDGKRPDLPKEIQAKSQRNKKLLPASKRRTAK